MFFKKRDDRKPDNDKGSVVFQMATGLLGVQVAMAGGSIAAYLEDDLWSVGYVFGLTDAMLQGARVDEQTKMVATIGVVFRSLLGSNEVAAPIFAKGLNSQADGDFREGNMAGGNEGFAFLKNKTPPLGLAMRLAKLRESMTAE